VAVFADSSALVKLYVPERGHDEVRRLEQPLLVSILARVEVPAAFWRKQRTGEIDDEDAGVLTQAFEFDLFGSDEEPPRFVVVELTSAVLDVAARCVARHGLRACDGIQLASAMSARVVVSTVDLAAFDGELRRAAAAEGLGLVPRSLP
jgi:predicted nucleic acid-binding protein